MYYVKKILALLATLLLVTMLSFFAFSVIPGDAAAIKLGTEASPKQLEALREEMGLNENVAVRYVKWLGGVFHGDFGKSSYYSKPVAELMSEKLPVTMLLSLMALLLIILIFIPLAVLMMVKENGLFDRIVMLLSRVMMAVPAFFLGLIIILVFGFGLKIFTVGGYVAPGEDFAGFLGFMIFPALAIAIPKGTQTLVFLRSNIIRELRKDYVRTLRASGLSKKRVLVHHALKNAMLPTITFIGLVAAEVLAGSVIVEQVFGIPGLGKLLVHSVTARDYNVTQAIVLYIGTVVVLINFTVDMLYRFFDPTVRVSGGKATKETNSKQGEA